MRWPLVCWALWALTAQSAKTLVARGDCQTATVASGDSCGSLASKCKISSEDFNKYNTAKDLCSALAPGERVCCSEGTLPDIRPKRQADGSCASHEVKSGDNCDAIAAANGLKRNDLSLFNDKTTWGWTGCKNLMAGISICLSNGRPPIPPPQPNAVCGPTKPGTNAPKGFLAQAFTNIADLNPCPLNACCNIWGQCGITPEFCKAEKGPTGNPGTAPTGHNGCVSNCGTDVANNKDAPTDFRSIGYYESWNWDRPCANLRASSIDTSFYTHVHWAFATISKEFDVVINDTYKQFSSFQSLNAKKIVSFGGWGYSTDPATYDVLREAMSDAHASTFASNVVTFLQKNNLDGVDFDWEYPGATDIPGTPPGSKSDGPTYLKFLKLLKSKLGEKTLSIAAPASYWYLKNFPIKDMAEVVDYIVYMTYDLHGQWDYGNKFSQEGCPAGNCLRSHVNITETNYVLAMITKAGVPANKITVGISNYGRSFKMTKAGCTGPMCGFAGPESAAAKGRCTQTAGYISNREIYDIIILDRSSQKQPNPLSTILGDPTQPKTSYDIESDSAIMVYNETEWVAYMSEEIRTSRTVYYKSLNFGGIIDWAVDLSKTADDDGDVNDDLEDQELKDPPDPVSCVKTYQTMEDLDADAANIDSACVDLYTLQTLANVLTNATNVYNDMMKNGYDGKFTTYSKAVSDNAAKTMHDWIVGNGNKYFTCTVAETQICCSECKANQDKNRPTYCNYCDGSCTQNCGYLGKRDLPELLEGADIFARDRPQPAAQCLKNNGVKNVSEPCPPDYSMRGYGPDDPYEQTVYWSLNADKVNQFWADLLDNTGIPQDKTKTGSYNNGNGCPPSAHADDPCWGVNMDFDIPITDNYGPSDVTNPKDLVQKALDNSQSLSDQLASAVLAIQTYTYYGDASDLVDAVSIPVLMVAQAVDSMSNVVTTADKIDEEKKKALILAFLGAILFFVPIAGELLGSVAELADVASVITVLGVAGNAAMDVYTIVDDPKNAPLAIFSLIMEPLALLDIAKVTKMASFRRDMKDDDVAKLGGKIASRMATIKKVCGNCKPADA